MTDVNGHREDAYCPACPDPETAFRIKDVGMKVEEGDLRGDDAFRITATRPLWEPHMLEHLRVTPDEHHQRLHAECTTFLAKRGQTAEENAQASWQALVDSAHRSINDLRRQPVEPAPTEPMRSQLLAMLKLDDLLEDWAIEGAQPTRRPTLPKKPSGFVCPTWNAVIYPPIRPAHDQFCGCRQ